MALGGVGHWLFFALGWMPRYQGYLHANIQVQLYLASFVAGFLMTAIPRFSGSSPSKTWETLGVFFLLIAITITHFKQQWIYSELFYGALIIFLARFIAVRFLTRQVENPPIEFMWIPVAMLIALAGVWLKTAILAGWVDASRMTLGRSLEEQGFVLAVVLGVGGFLGPRLLNTASLSNVTAINLKEMQKIKIITHAVLAVCFVGSFILEAYHSHAAYALRAILVTTVFLKTRVLHWKPLKEGSLFQKLLALSFVSIALGYWLLTFFPRYRVTLLHFVFLSGFSLMIYCVSTMVVLSHSGNGGRLHEGLWIFWLFGVGTASAISLRICADFVPEHYFLFLGVSAASWLAAGLGWLFFCGEYLWSGQPSLSFEESHKRFARGSAHSC